MRHFKTNNKFNHDKFFKTFLKSIHSIVYKLEKNQSWRNDFTMEPLRTSSKACEKCMKRDKLIPEVMRCYHKQGCLHNEGCGCKDFNIPSLSRSKVGAVFHLAFRNEDGTVDFMDLDLNCPTMDSGTSYDGQIFKIQEYLLKYKVN